MLQQAEVTAGNNAGSRLYLWLVFALLIGLMMSNYLSRQVVTVLFPFLKADWSLSDTQLGSLASVVALTVGLLSLPISLLVDRYGRVLGVTVMALLAKNMVRTNIGRSWMAIRDMDMAAEVIGFRPMQTKLMAFAVSSFYCGVAGALFAYAYLGTVEPEGFNLDLSFRILFMIIIGGVGSILGSFLGAAFIVLLPIGLNMFMHFLEGSVGINLPSGISSSIELMVFGGLIIFFLIVEPHGLARLWQIGKEKLRLWPFPH